jgi:hypothetical protein
MAEPQGAIYLASTGSWPLRSSSGITPLGMQIYAQLRGKAPEFDGAISASDDVSRAKRRCSRVLSR